MTEINKKLQETDINFDLKEQVVNVQIFGIQEVW